MSGELTSITSALRTIITGKSDVRTRDSGGGFTALLGKENLPVFGNRGSTEPERSNLRSDLPQRRLLPARDPLAKDGAGEQRADKIPAPEHSRSDESHGRKAGHDASATKPAVTDRDVALPAYPDRRDSTYPNLPEEKETDRPSLDSMPIETFDSATPNDVNRNGPAPDWTDGVRLRLDSGSVSPLDQDAASPDEFAVARSAEMSDFEAMREGPRFVDDRSAEQISPSETALSGIGIPAGLSPQLPKEPLSLRRNVERWRSPTSDIAHSLKDGREATINKSASEPVPLRLIPADAKNDIVNPDIRTGKVAVEASGGSLHRPLEVGRAAGAPQADAARGAAEPQPGILNNVGQVRVATATSSLLNAIRQNSNWSDRVSDVLASSSVQFTPSGRREPTQHSLKIRLHPAELGVVTATIRMSGDRLSVSLEVEHERTLTMLAQDKQIIHNSLRALGFQVDELTIGNSQQSQTTAEMQSERGQHQTRNRDDQKHDSSHRYSDRPPNQNGERGKDSGDASSASGIYI